MRTLLLLALIGLDPGPGAAPASTCSAGCYQRKSIAYQRCRIIAPAERAARVACFQRADAELQKCLGHCR